MPFEKWSHLIDQASSAGGFTRKLKTNLTLFYCYKMFFVTMTESPQVDESVLNLLAHMLQ